MDCLFALHRLNVAATVPIFGTKKANNRRTLSDLLKIAHPLPEYKALARIVGHKTADSALAMTYVIDSGFAQGDAKRLSDDMRVVLQKEMNDVLAGHYDLGRILTDAAGEFSKSRNEPTRFLKPSDYGALGSEADAMKAAKWVSYQSASLTPDQNGDTNTAAITRIEAAIKTGLFKNLWSDTFPSFLHAACAPKGTYDEHRGIMLGAKYPSTAGGQYLIKAGIRMMRGIPKPAPETRGWYDVASFLFGTIIRAHSFSDGNGRVARASYAVAIIKGGLAFAAPTKANEDEMCKLR
jgi:hypothetical protein